ncbi:MAG TPA: thiolase family protein [Burkholderiaceae bacterium]|nr:thiolase family protein [Burkholderiaceae bacterium]
MSDIYVVGVGMTPWGKFLDRSVKDLARASVGAALADAGLERGDVEVAFFANAGQSAIEGQFMVGGQIALRDMGIGGIPVTNVENACASGSTAFHQAYAYLKAGMADVALAVGAEKLYHDDRARSFNVFNGAWDVHGVEALTEALAGLGEGVEPPPGRAADSGVRSVFMDVYAALAKQHMKLHGTTERHLAAVSAKNHHHSTMNPLSQYRMDMSIDDVLGARMISWPLTLPMCAPISDGAAAAILVREEALGRFDRTRAIRIRASVLASGADRGPEELDRHVCRIAARRAYELAGIGPDDVSVAEVHDATAFGEILQTENLGFCEPGQGGWLAERGETSLGGRIPVNPSGGLESTGHPIGATGLGQIHELVMQLRGESGARQVAGARVALAENGGGFHGSEEAAACITVLSR